MNEGRTGHDTMGCVMDVAIPTQFCLRCIASVAKLLKLSKLEQSEFLSLLRDDYLQVHDKGLLAPSSIES